MLKGNVTATSLEIVWINLNSVNYNAKSNMDAFTLSLSFR